MTIEGPRPLLNDYTVGRTGSAANAWALARATYPSVPRLEVGQGPRPFELHQRLVGLDDVKLMALTTTGHRIDLEDHGHLNVVLPRSGRLTVDDGRRVATAAPGAVLVPGLGRRDSRFGPDYEGLYVMVRRSALEARFEVEGARARTAWADGLGRVGRSMPAATSLGDLVDVLVRDIERHGLLARFERPRRNAAALLMDAVVALHLSCGEASGRLAPPASAGAWHVARAEAFIVANAGEPLSIADIAAAAGTGTRSLQLAFKRHRGSTPRAFLQACRLERLYRGLWAAEPGTRVVDVALESGITHLGRAAAAYRRRFGETPSQTLAQALRHR